MAHFSVLRRLDSCPLATTLCECMLLLCTFHRIRCFGASISITPSFANCFHLLRSANTYGRCLALIKAIVCAGEPRAFKLRVVRPCRFSSVNLRLAFQCAKFCNHNLTSPASPAVFRPDQARTQMWRACRTSATRSTATATDSTARAQRSEGTQSRLTMRLSKS